MWIKLSDFIIYDMFDNESDEILNALKGFTGLEKKLNQDW